VGGGFGRALSRRRKLVAQSDLRRVAAGVAAWPATPRGLRRAVSSPPASR
jgi:hypothetical protein